jgi:hypothetical protein
MPTTAHLARRNLGSCGSPPVGAPGLATVLCLRFAFAIDDHSVCEHRGTKSVVTRDARRAV